MESSPGFCGKLPTNGDFVRRRVPPEFALAWDDWLERCLHAAQTELGGQWLDAYLAAPAWRFALAPGACGSAGLCGVMLPSVDRVGRHFPITVVRRLAPQERALQLASGPGVWFEAVEALLADAVQGEIGSLEEFDQRLQALVPARPQVWPAQLLAASADLSLSSAAELPALAGALAHDGLARQVQTPLTFWWTAGAGGLNARLRWRAGLPAAKDFPQWLGDVRDIIPPLAVEELLGPVSQAAAAPVSAPAVPANEDRTETRLKLPAEALAVQPVDDPLALFDGGAEPQPQVQPEPATATHYRSAGITHRGNRRKHNQDAFLDAPDKSLWVVADGMGGWKDGDRASRMVVDALAELPPTSSLTERVRLAREALARVNRELRRNADDPLDPVESGSTVVALMAQGSELAVLWAGDSRAYRLRDGALEQLSRDHSLAQAAKDAFGDAHRDSVPENVITRAVGGESVLETDVLYERAQAGDRYLLCSDGLYRELDHAQLAELLANAEPEGICECLCKAVLAGAASDNLTALVLHCRP